MHTLLLPAARLKLGSVSLGRSNRLATLLECQTQPRHFDFVVSIECVELHAFTDCNCVGHRRHADFSHLSQCFDCELDIGGELICPELPSRILGCSTEKRVAA